MKPASDPLLMNENDKNRDDDEDDLRPEYDPLELTGGIRGKYLDQYRHGEREPWQLQLCQFVTSSWPTSSK
jgi:hypothetical protein